MHKDALISLKAAAVVERALPRNQPRRRQARTHGEIGVAWQRREITRIDRHELRQRAVVVPVREAEHSPPNRQSGRPGSLVRHHDCPDAAPPCIQFSPAQHLRRTCVGGTTHSARYDTGRLRSWA